MQRTPPDVYKRQEIISGSVPDLFLTSSLPIDKYAAKGVVADLYTFMDGGSGLSRDYFVPQVLKAIEKDGKLYELPTKFSVETAYALSSIVDQYDTWNVAAVQDAMAQLQEGDVYKRQILNAPFCQTLM